MIKGYSLPFAVKWDWLLPDDKCSKDIAHYLFEDAVTGSLSLLQTNTNDFFPYS